MVYIREPSGGAAEPTGWPGQRSRRLAGAAVGEGMPRRGSRGGVAAAEAAVAVLAVGAAALLREVAVAVPTGNSCCTGRS